MVKKNSHFYHLQQSCDYCDDYMLYEISEWSSFVFFIWKKKSKKNSKKWKSFSILLDDSKIISSLVSVKHNYSIIYGYLLLLLICIILILLSMYT